MAQKTDSIIKTRFVTSFELNADEFIGVDEFDNNYYLKDNTLHKKGAKETFTYTNTQLGKITSVDIKNPLKIILFYTDFNTVVLLDNKLNELANQIDFSNASFSKNIALVAGSSTNNLWLYSLDDNTLQLYNYNTEKVGFKSQPLSFGKTDFIAKKLVSSYKNCWLLGENRILQFNEYGIFIDQLEIGDIEDLKIVNNGFIYLKNNLLNSYKNDTVKSINLKKEISIKSFYVNKNEIYIFDGTTIFVYSFTKK